MTINVLTGGSLPRLLSDIVRTLVHDEPDICIEAEGLSIEELIEHLQQHATDVVIVGCEPHAMASVGHSLLEQTHRTRVIAVAAKDCDAVLYSLTPVSHPLGRLSARSLLSAIRLTESGAIASGQA